MPPTMDCSYRFNNSVFKEPVMPRFEKYSILNPCSIFEKLPQPHQKFFQPPRFIVGGFVGSKVCELKNDPVTPVNYSNLFGHIFSVFTSIQDPNVKKNISMASKYSPPVVQHKSPVKMNPVAQPELPVNRIVSETSETPTKDKNCNNRTVSESSDTSWVSMNSVDSDSSRVATDTVEDCKNIQNQADNYRNCRTVSESSTTSWGSDNPMEEDQGKLILEASPWLSSMFVRANDSDSDSSDSEWDQSENGQVVDFIRWQGDSLSPICSPTIPHVAGSISLDYDSDDSDDSDGILISCGNYHYDDEEEQRDHEEKRLFLEGINQRWNERMDQVGDETDAPAITNKQTKKVHFAPNKQLVHTQLMITWGHAYRSARKGDWERMRRDNERFQQRIQSSASILNPILDENHRLMAWNRIQNWNQAALSSHTEPSSN